MTRGAVGGPLGGGAPRLSFQQARVGGDVDRVFAQGGEGHDVERPLVGRRQHHERGRPFAMGPQPVDGGDAPPVSRPEPGKAELERAMERSLPMRR